MDLIIDNYIIDAPIMEILTECKKELTNGKLRVIKDNGTWVSITCPFHSGGMEKENSCGVVSDPHSKVEYGTFNCFACKESGKLYHLIAGCFDESDDFGKKWLINKFGKRFSEVALKLEKIELPKPEVINYLDERILDTFQSYHPYMTKRKLTPEVISKFKIKYDPHNQCLIFPVWDECDRLLFLTSRNVNYKFYQVPEDVDKPIYLLNFILRENIKEVVVVESQINCLTCWSYGIPAIALFGSTLTTYQRDILKKSGIRHYILALDGDDAGKKGVERFKSMIGKDVFVDVMQLPPTKDVNDLTYDEFINYYNSAIKNS